MWCHKLCGVITCLGPLATSVLSKHHSVSLSQAVVHDLTSRGRHFTLTAFDFIKSMNDVPRTYVCSVVFNLLLIKKWIPFIYRDLQDCLDSQEPQGFPWVFQLLKFNISLLITWLQLGTGIPPRVQKHYIPTRGVSMALVPIWPSPHVGLQWHHFLSTSCLPRVCQGRMDPQVLEERQVAMEQR